MLSSCSIIVYHEWNSWLHKYLNICKYIIIIIYEVYAIFIYLHVSQ